MIVEKVACGLLLSRLPLHRGPVALVLQRVGTAVREDGLGLGMAEATGRPG